MNCRFKKYAVAVVIDEKDKVAPIKLWLTLPFTQDRYYGYQYTGNWQKWTTVRMIAKLVWYEHFHKDVLLDKTDHTAICKTFLIQFSMIQFRADDID